MTLLNSDISAKIDNYLQQRNSFFAQCVQSLKETAGQEENPGSVAEVRRQTEAAIGAYNSGQIDQSFAMFSAIVENAVCILARPKSKNIVDLIFSLFPNEKQFSEGCRFRLRVICAVHGITAFHSPERDLQALGLLTHNIKKPLPTIQFGNSPATENPQRIEACERLIKAYHKALEEQKNASINHKDADLWTTVIDTELSELVSLVEQKNAQKLANFMINFGSTPMRYGGVTTSRDKDHTENLEDPFIGLTYFDKLLSLAEYLGLLPAEMLNSDRSGLNFHSKIDELVGGIENHLAISITPPMGIIHTDGIVAAGGLFHNVHINGLYNATRIKSLNPSNEACCEYGGGIGISAMYARRMGIMDYTIFDLPITNLLSGHYLLLALGLDAVSLYGEKTKENTVKILPFWEATNAKDKQFFLSVNQDSFPEVSEKLVEEYLLQIRRTTKKYFLSLNHEGFSPYTVRNVVNRTPGYESLSRSKYWIYEGFLEELFKIL